MYDTEVQERKRPFYIGISKLCCRDCHLAITSLNGDSARSATGPEVYEVVDVRGEHLESYPWAEPDFFTVRPAAKVMYAEFKKGPEPRTVGRHLADASDSEPEIEIVADRLAASLTSSTTAVSSSTPMSSTRRKGAGREK